MPMSISEIYDYVFGHKAKTPRLPEGVKLTPQQQEKKERDDADAKVAKKDAFEFITSNPGLSLEFRNLLRAVKSTDLERLLYGNTIDVLEKMRQSPRYEIPTEEAISAQFETLNREYGYFTETSLETFIQLLKASKLIADFVEENNSADNAVAYLHAYKMMVLFKIDLKSPFSGINKYIGAHWKDKPKAIHDALVLAIPKNTPRLLQHLASWQELIMQHGNEALSLFQQAQAIEPRLEGPMSLIAVQKAAAQLQYKRHAIHPELALLCGQYHVSEENFDKCLAIIPKKQKDEQLPEVMVEGAPLGHPGYYLVKLPIGDPRAYILGHITNCCQNIGGESEQCVIDGITRKQNGFYVLLNNPKALKADPKDPPPKALIDGKINYANYEIVGQGYAWLSELDNLTFDSWENLTPSTDDQVIVNLLAAFTQQCFKEKPSVGRITIGMGGKTPKAYAAETPYPEKIAEGFQYEDSSRQASIAMNHPALLKETARINEKLNPMGIALSFELFSMKQIKWLESLLSETALRKYKDALGESTYQALLKKSTSNPDYLAVITLLHQADLLTKDTSVLILSLHNEHVHDIAETLSTLHKANPTLVSDKNFKLLTKRMQYAMDITNALSHLYRANPALISDKNFTLLMENAQYASNMDKALSKLHEVNPALINDENIRLLDQNAQYAHIIMPALSTLFKTNPALINNEHRKLLANNASSANGLALALSTLYEADPLLVNDKNRTLLANKARYAKDMAKVLSILYRINPTLVSDKNCKLLDQNAVFAHVLAQALSDLQNVNPALVNDETFNQLSKNAQRSNDMPHHLSTLYNRNPTLANDENFKLLALNTKYATTIFLKLHEHYESNPGSFTNAYLKKLLADMRPQAAAITNEKPSQLGLFSSRTTGFKEAPDKTLEKESESK